MSEYNAYIGIDLAAKLNRCTGFVAIASADLRVAEAACLGSDDEIVNSVRKWGKAVVAIDAPFGFGNGFIRNVDRKMISLGFKVFPPGFSHMKTLTTRAIELVKKLKNLDVVVLETHPKSVLKSSKCNNVQELSEKLGIKEIEKALNGVKDIKDALLAAIASLCYAINCSYKVEDIDGTIWLVKELC